MIKELQLGWASVKLEEIADVMDYEREPINSTERSLRVEGKDQAQLYPYYGATGQIGFIDNFRTEGTRILLGEDGAPFLDQNKDKAYLVSGRFWVNNHAHVLQGAAGLVNNKFLCYQLNVIDYQQFVSGTTRLKLTSSAMKQIPLILAPLKEQERIVDKLEELLSDLNAGVEELKSAKAKLVQYRQSLLKSAVEGTLTAEWRTKNIPKETGEELLQRILKERRKNWEGKQLAKYKEQGKQPPKGWQDKYTEPVQPDTKGLPELPTGWILTSLDALISNGPQNGLYLPKSNYGNGVPILRIDDFQIGWHRERSKLNRVQMEQNLLNIYSLNIGELVINRVNSMTHLGKSLEVTKELEGIVFESNMMRIQLSALVSPSLVATYLGSDFGRKLLINNAKWAVNQASINQQDVKNTPIPLMPIEEQTEININIKQQFEAVDNQLLAVEKGFNQLEVQRKNILKSAFTGQLVSQSVDDEPASVLLERIKKERLKNSSDKNKKVKGKKPMKKNIHESLREWIISRGDKPFSFEEISKSISSEYEQIKDVIYDLLSEKKPIIEQVFNEDLQQMVFKKVKQ